MPRCCSRAVPAGAGRRPRVQEGHAGDGGRRRVGQPTPVQQCRARITECAEYHGPGTEKIRGVASDVEAEQGHHAGEADDQAEGASAVRNPDLTSHNASTAVNSGSVAVRNFGYREPTCCSPQAVKKVGAAMSSRVTTAMGTITWRRPRNARAWRPAARRTLRRRGPAEHDRGRFNLGVGTGEAPNEYVTGASGRRPGTPAELEEAVTIIAGLFTGEQLTYQRRRPT